MKSAYHIGISFYTGHLQLAEVEHGKRLTLTALGERPTSIDFTDSGASFSAVDTRIPTLVYELEELIKESRARGKSISFALPTAPVFINIVPVDSSLRGDQLTAHLQWEVSQHHPGATLREYIISSQELPWETSSARNVLTVSVHRGVVGFLKRAAAELRLQVKLIDVDQFSTEKALRHSYPEVSRENVVLLGIRGDGVDASLVFQGELVDYRAFRASAADDVRRAAQEYLRFLKDKDGIDAPGKIFLHGSDTSGQVVSLLERETGIRTEALDAVRNLSPSKKISESSLKNSARFAAAVGLALREAQ